MADVALNLRCVKCGHVETVSADALRAEGERQAEALTSDAMARRSREAAKKLVARFAPPMYRRAAELWIATRSDAEVVAAAQEVLQTLMAPPG